MGSMMVDKILALYWTPEGTPHWKHHLPALLISAVLLALVMSIGLLHPKSLFALFLVQVISQFAFSALARRRFGNNNPKNNSAKE